MSDLISRQAAINALENTDCELSSTQWDELTDAIMQLPTADVRENVRGEWRYYPILDRFGRRTGKHYAICSICCTPLPETIHESEVCFCMKCGADMRGERDDIKR